MRRLTAYVTMSLSLLVAVGVSFVPATKRMNADLDYGAAHEVVYNLTNKEDGSFVDTNQYIDDVASTMRERLDNYDIDSYSVVVEGNDTVRVKFAAENDTEYANVRDYLAFSGGDFSMATQEEESRRDHDTLFKDVTARIEYVNSIPYVVIPVSDVSAMKSLIETAQSSSEEEGGEAHALRHQVKRADEGEAAEQSPDLYLWANWKEGDDFEKANADQAVTGKKIIASFYSSNIWFKENLKDDEEPTEIQYLCGYADAEGNYDVNKLEEANNLAVKLTNLFNASKYENIEIKITYERNIDAVVDELVSPGTLNTSITLVATGLALIIMALLLIVFYRLGALSMISNNVVVSFLTLFFFLLLGATMNISSLIGIGLVSLANLASLIFYMTKLKDLVYKGYSLKKANQEAFKKFTLFTVDTSVIFLFSGLIIFLIGGNLLKSMGVTLFFGGVISLIVNETLFRASSYLLTNNQRVNDRLDLINFDKNLINSPMENDEGEQKEPYKGPYAKTDFTKKNKLVAILGGVFIIAGIAMSTIFGIKNKTIINTSALTKDTTQVYLVVKYDDSAIVTIKNEEIFETNILKNIKVNGEALKYSNVEHGSRSETDYETTVTTNYDYYVTSIDAVYTNNDTFAYVYEGSETTVYSIEEAIYGLAEKYEPYVDTTNYIDYATKVSHETVINEPNFGWVSLACSISIIGCGIYLALRYKLHRALSTVVLTILTSFGSIALFAITRLPATPVVYVVIPATMIISLLISLFYINKDKELTNEIRSADLTEEKRSEIIKLATSNATAPVLIFVIIALYYGINYFGFGPVAYAKLFGGIIVSTLLVALFTIKLLLPFANLIRSSFNKLLSKRVKREKPKKQQRIKLQQKPKTSEPEETIFIGIND